MAANEALGDAKDGAKRTAHQASRSGPLRAVARAGGLGMVRHPGHGSRGAGAAPPEGRAGPVSALPEPFGGGFPGRPPTKHLGSEDSSQARNRGGIDLDC